MRIVGSHHPAALAIPFDQDTKQGLGGRGGKIETIHILDRLALGSRLETIVVSFALINGGEAIHQVRYLGAATLHKAETKLGDRGENAAEQRIGQYAGGLERR